MRRALHLAARGPATGPNPRVGCVLLAPDGHVLAEGHHRGAGTAHAEAAALADLAARAGTAAGCTAVVTLEPCTHTGRTGPCAQALLAAGATRVVIADTDPNPAAAGGADLLRTAGVDVEVGLLADAAHALNERWATAVARARPWVTWKFAATLDGRSAAADGTSRWITSAPARADVHRLRAGHDAVLVGTGTALADDPALTVRRDDDTEAGTETGTEDGPQPLRVVAGLRDLPAGARLRDGRAELLHVRTRDPHEVLHALAQREVRTVLLEGGPALAAAFARAGLVDEVVAYLAPALLGAGAAAVADLGVTGIAGALRLDLAPGADAVLRVGDDVRVTARPRARPAGERAPDPSHPPVVEEVARVHRDR
ncbi:bifunctional diaminohydroxyphosphoribosylaminopyrimidine deaminase/5-amino-6-(5-phosphoribosylamino)uracil reductase RibD [Kineococcus sp. TRM81007]|uniref:bifunctional diaminohydroxyphosphoribosylaminopyrimidine deaminase/5-amino-6-(5-phosphoribosylamino)uracil reductase RibD n=1 Tax=Kineococcus sp. TRM81007 TaxID=2925831 RepID=UPI00210250B6